MTTFEFSLKYSFLVPDNLFNIAKMKLLDTASYMSTDLAKKTYLFPLNFELAKFNSQVTLFALRYSINNKSNYVSFLLPYIYNKQERSRTFLFGLKNRIATIGVSTKVFQLKSKIQIDTKYTEYGFSLKYQNASAGLKVFRFSLKNRIEKNTTQHKDFFFPYTLTTGDNKLPAITVDSTTNGVSHLSYRIDGISANIGDVVDMLASEILVPKVVYVVINNGSFSLLRTARFEIRESTKELIMEDQGISLSLDVDKIKVSFTADITVPVSIKLYRGIP